MAPDQAKAFACLLVLAIGSAFSSTAIADAHEGAKDMPAVKIYHMEGRRSERVVWLMEELDLPYELFYRRGDLRGTALMLRSVNSEMPMFPTVFLGDQKLVESGAIIETIINRYAPGQLQPALESEHYPNHKMWMHFAEGSMAARLFSDYRQWRQTPPTTRSRLVDSEATVQFAEDYLKEHAWFGGDSFSTADIMMLFPLEVATVLNLVDADQFPAVAEWKAKVKARPAYQTMLSKARPDGMIGSLPPVERHAPSGPRQ